MDAIRGSKKKWLVEKEANLRRKAQQIANLPQDFPQGSQRLQTLITEGLMQVLSGRQLTLLQHLEAQYGSDIRQTVAHMLSEFMTEMSALPNISVRMKKFQTTYEPLLEQSGMKMLDRWHVVAFVATLASGGACDFHVMHSHKGIGIRGTGNPVGFPDSD